jgi:hypothetical protein
MGKIGDSVALATSKIENHWAVKVPMVNYGCNMGKNGDSVALATSKIEKHWEMCQW